MDILFLARYNMFIDFHLMEENMKEDKNSKIHSDDKTDLNEILDKMLRLQEGNKAPSFLKKQSML